MDIKLIDKKQDLADINGWMPFPVTADQLPGHTFCALYSGKIIAIAGLRLMEGTMCFLDSMASDQSAPGEVRNKALDKLTETIFEKAKELGFKSVLAHTKEPCILERAFRHGFEPNAQMIIVKEF